MPRRLRTSDRYYAFSSLLAARAVRQARRARSLQAAGLVVAQYQASQALEAQAADTAMLAEQGIRVAPEAALVPVAFTTDPRVVASMLSEAETDKRFELIVRSLVQDAGRSAQVVDSASRPHVQHVRHLNLPSCSRCAVLAGRVYRYSTGFERHPGCDCTMIPVTAASPDLTYDPTELAREGLISGLSKSDLEAIDLGADFGKVVNVRLRAARKNGGLSPAGEVLRRGNRPTPAGILRAAGDDRDKALALLQTHGYIR